MLTAGRTSGTLGRLQYGVWKHRYVYLFLLPGVIHYAIFSYTPMMGLILAFKKYSARYDILGSPWVGLSNFERIFITPKAITAILNTLQISFGRILFEFPIPILLAILLNEMRGTRVKRIYQTVYTFPHFLSWVIVATILKDFFSTNGVINYIIASLGGERISFLSNNGTFRFMIYFTSNWKEMGWSAIIYIASISGINPDLYEAASIDGAGRLQRIWHVTLPGLRSIILVMLILKIGNSMNAGFDQIFNLSNSVVKNSSDIIDTYIYDITFQTAPNYGFSTAVGMFKSVINTLLLVTANYCSMRFFHQGLFGAEER